MASNRFDAFYHTERFKKHLSAVHFIPKEQTLGRWNWSSHRMLRLVSKQWICALKWLRVIETFICVLWMPKMSFFRTQIASTRLDSMSYSLTVIGPLFEDKGKQCTFKNPNVHQVLSLTNKCILNAPIDFWSDILNSISISISLSAEHANGIQQSLIFQKSNLANRKNNIHIFVSRRLVSSASSGQIQECHLEWMSIIYVELLSLILASPNIVPMSSKIKF